MKKPSPSVINAAVPLSQLRDPVPDRCSICGVHVDPDDLPALIYREHDTHDHASAVFVFLCHSKACAKALDDHPRLYSRDNRIPGTFPRLCVGCVHRRGQVCLHKDQKALGGAGLLVHFEGLRAKVNTGRGCFWMPQNRTPSRD